MTPHRAAAAVSALSVVLLSGCATSGPLHRDFGDSVRNMVAAQRYTPPDAERRLHGNAPLDAEKAAAILQIHRTDISKPQEVRDELRIQVAK
jgi:hypothetical protein